MIAILKHENINRIEKVRLLKKKKKKADNSET